MAFLLAFLAARAFALGSVRQQKGTVETSAGARDPRFLVQILRRPVWLAGIWAAGGRLVLQAFVFLLAGSPQVGTSQPDAAAWWAAILATVVVIGLLVGFGRYRTGAVRALLLGSAAGVLFALQAAVTKVFMTQLGHGVAALLGNWTTYALIVSAIAGFVIQQSALRTDVLAPALAASNAVTLFASAVFGLTVSGETLSDGNGRLASAIIGLILALAGIVLLAGAKPAPHADQALPGPASSSPPGA